MFDTVYFYLLQQDFPGTNFIRETSKHISIVSESNSKFGKYIVGNYRGYKVVINRSKISFSNCSLARFMFGNNLKTLTRGTTKEAIMKMQDELRLPMKEANITRLDIAQHLPMKHIPSLYMPLLGECQYYTRLEQPNGINYQNTKRVKTFYNKTLEQQDKNKALPEIYSNAKLLRYELRFVSRLPQQFNMPKVNLSLLYSEDFYYMAVRKWRQEYLDIKKLSVNTNSLIATGSSKCLIEQLAAHTVINNGQDRLLKTIKEWQEFGAISKKQAFDLRKSVQKLTVASDKQSSNYLIQELDRKIKEAARFC